jgi:hypothetical protein
MEHMGYLSTFTRSLVNSARQQLALAVQWGCKDYYDALGRRSAWKSQESWEKIWENALENRKMMVEVKTMENDG